MIYVLEGDLEYEIAGKVTRVKPGDVLFVPAGTPHLARNLGSRRGAELATYIVENGKPLLTVLTSYRCAPRPCRYHGGRG
ncbi:MAG: cupin domain-containing protein [Vicinamibacterales bacterium]